MCIRDRHNTARQTAASAQSSNWGLSFQEEGKRPVGNATIDVYKRQEQYLPIIEGAIDGALKMEQTAKQKEDA